jgi:hypothetical protein
LVSSDGDLQQAHVFRRKKTASGAVRLGLADGVHRLHAGQVRAGGRCGLRLRAVVRAHWSAIRSGAAR